MLHALEALDRKRHRQRHAAQAQLAIHARGPAIDEIHQLATIGCGGKPCHVENILAARMGVHAVMAEINAVGVDQDVDLAGARLAIHRHGAGSGIELAAPGRQTTKMIGLEAGESVGRVDFITNRLGNGRQGKSGNGSGENRETGRHGNSFGKRRNLTRCAASSPLHRSPCVPPPHARGCGTDSVPGSTHGKITAIGSCL